MTFEGNAYFPSGKHTTYGNIRTKNVCKHFDIQIYTTKTTCAITYICIIMHIKLYCNQANLKKFLT